MLSGRLLGGFGDSGGGGAPVYGDLRLVSDDYYAYNANETVPSPLTVSATTGNLLVSCIVNRNQSSANGWTNRQSNAGANIWSKIATGTDDITIIGSSVAIIRVFQFAPIGGTPTFIRGGFAGPASGTSGTKWRSPSLASGSETGPFTDIVCMSSGQNLGWNPATMSEEDVTDGDIDAAWTLLEDGQDHHAYDPDGGTSAYYRTGCSLIKETASDIALFLTTHEITNWQSAPTPTWASVVVRFNVQ